MRVIRWWGEPLNELVDRLFSLEGKADAIKRATRSIVEANLHLPLGAGDAQEESMVPGSVIAVPPVPGATLRDSVQPVSVAVADSLLAKLQSALPSVSTELERADARALDASANVLD